MAPSPSHGSHPPAFEGIWGTFLEDYLRTYFTERNLEATLAMFSPGLAGFGTGADEAARRPGEMEALYARDLGQSRRPVAYRVHWADGFALGAEAGVIQAVISIEAQTEEGPIAFDGLRLTAVLGWQGRRWLLVHHHLSEPTGRQEAGESFPIKQLRLFNDRLREEVRRKTEELEQRNQALEAALAQVQTLRGLIPICASCKKIRDDSGFWSEVEVYLHAHSEVQFTHGLCPTCIPKYFPGRG